jgi:hypothetical protein
MRAFVVACAVLLSVSSRVDAQSVLCESLGAYRECRVGSSGTIRMVMELSQRACFEGVTWGTLSSGVVWVDRNCRARFAIDAARPQAAGKSRVVCESRKGDRQVCPADTTAGVVLAQQVSRTECVQGKTWGFDDERELIWVDGGCRAEFLLGGAAPAARPPVHYESTVTCESDNGRRKQCNADTSAGVQLVRELADAECGFGTEWGYDTKGVWVTKGCRAEFAVGGKPKAIARAVTCASTGARNECAADTQYGVALVRQLGANECVLDRTWGFDANGVWVADGCHAQFVLGGFRLPANAVPANAAKVTCESLDGKRTQCNVETGRGVGLVRQTSEATCILNRTWGYDSTGIWVDAGCRAEFAVAR